MNSKELEKFQSDLKSLSKEEIDQKLKDFFIRREKNNILKREEERKNHLKYEEEANELKSIYAELESRKQLIDASNLEGSRCYYEVNILCEKGKYPINRRQMKEWIEAFPGVKCVNVDDREIEEIEEIDWDYCFQEFFEDKRIDK